jgi:hypothetical protein
VCYGARTDPPTNSYWGVDIDNSQGCDDCCTLCENVSRSIRLTC